MKDKNNLGFQKMQTRYKIDISATQKKIFFDKNFVEIKKKFIL